MPLKMNKDLVRRDLEEVGGQRKLDVADEIFAAEYIYHINSEQQVQNLDDYKQWFRDTLALFPDFHGTIEDMIAENDKVAVRWIFIGTKDGNKVIINGMSIYRIASGRIVETWNSYQRNNE